MILCTFSNSDVIVEVLSNIYVVPHCRLEARLYSDADPFIAQSKGVIDSFTKTDDSNNPAGKAGEQLQ